MEPLFLDIDATRKEPLIQVDPNIVKFLKPHQIEGVKFIWDSCFEKVKMIQDGHKGSGCILAHCMGLGKTLQIVALVHTLIANSHLTNVKRVLILLPINVLTNWRNEFDKWTKNCKTKMKLFDLPDNKGLHKDLMRARLNELDKWSKGGVLMIGYTMYARLVEGKTIKPKKYVEPFREHLLKGPDMIVCDEGHTLKNEKTAISKAVSQVETKRRVVLTGTPLQNNLVEYHCMVSFVKPKLLGTLPEFKNRFANPINNGQHKDSTESDVR